jgi:osmotically-inducible protein OsmY
MDDKQLQSMVIEALEWEPEVDAAHIGVTARDGVVTLSGTVSSSSEKVAAERATRRLKGVRGIAEEIVVRWPLDKTQSDDEIARRVLDTLDWDSSVPHDRINVKVERGHVTLTGNVNWHYQKRQAAQDALRIRGVLGVMNAIQITPSVAPTDIMKKIDGALRRSATLEASHVHVAVERGMVKLSGTVRSYSDRDLAEDTAWSAPGVLEVDNQLRVEA